MNSEVDLELAQMLRRREREAGSKVCVNYQHDMGEMSVKGSIQCNGALSESDMARVLAYALERLDKALTSEYERVIEEEG